MLLENAQTTASGTKPLASAISVWKVALWILLFSSLGLRKAAQVAKGFKPDIVIGHTYLGMFPAYALSRLFGIPSVARIHGTNESEFRHHPSSWALLRSPELFSLRLPMDLFAIDDDGTAGDRVAQAAGVPLTRIAVLPNAVDKEALLKPYDDGSIRRGLGIERDATVVLAVSRLARWKRVDRIVTAMRGVRRDRSIVCVIVGDGPERTRLEEEARVLGEVDRIRFIGSVNHSEIARYFAIADIFVSTNDLTNLCIPLLEAVTCGKCVVTLNVGGTRRMIENGRTGVLLEPSAPAELPRAINRLVENPDLRQSLARAAMEFARENVLTWDERATRELAIYANLARANRR